MPIIRWLIKKETVWIFCLSILLIIQVITIGSPGNTFNMGRICGDVRTQTLMYKSAGVVSFPNRLVTGISWII